MAQFSFPLHDRVDEALHKVETLIKDAGGSFSGDRASGVFIGHTPLGEVHGTYTISAHTVTVDITRKPWLLPQSQIESTIRAFFQA